MPASAGSPDTRVPQGERTRREILRRVRAAPGIHKSRLQRESGFAWGTLSYHLHVLGKRGSIRRVFEAGRLRIFPAGLPGRQQALLSALEDVLPREILRRLDSEPNLGIQELSRIFQVSRKVIRRHLTALGNAGLVARSTAYRPRFRVRPEIGPPAPPAAPPVEVEPRGLALDGPWPGLRTR